MWARVAAGQCAVCCAATTTLQSAVAMTSERWSELSNDGCTVGAAEEKRVYLFTEKEERTIEESAAYSLERNDTVQPAAMESNRRQKHSYIHVHWLSLSLSVHLPLHFLAQLYGAHQGTQLNEASTLFTTKPTLCLGHEEDSDLHHVLPAPRWMSGFPRGTQKSPLCLE